MFKSEERKKKEETMKKMIEEKEIIRIPPNSIRSIEELARLSTEIKGLGIGYLSRSQIKWIYSGGLEVLKKTKPLIAKLVERMEEVPGVFPVNLREVAELVQERIRERAEKGEISERWRKAVVTPAEVDAILRFKRDPYFSREEKTELIAQTLVEVLEEIYEEEKAQHRVEEPEVKVALEVARKWLERFRRAKGKASGSAVKRS